MTSADISLLRDILKTGRTMVWMPDHAPIRKVALIVETKTSMGSKKEPVMCAHFEDGGFVQLPDCNPNHFFTAVPFFCLPSFTPSQQQRDDFDRERGSTY